MTLLMKPEPKEEAGWPCALCHMLNPNHRRLFSETEDMRGHAAIHARHGQAALRRTLERCFPDAESVLGEEMKDEEPRKTQAKPPPRNLLLPQDLGQPKEGSCDGKVDPWSPLFIAEITIIHEAMKAHLTAGKTITCTCSHAITPTTANGAKEQLGTRLRRVLLHLTQEHLGSVFHICALCRAPLSGVDAARRRAHFPAVHGTEAPAHYDLRPWLEPKLREELKKSFAEFTEGVEAKARLSVAEPGLLIQGMPEGGNLPWSDGFREQLLQASVKFRSSLAAGTDVVCEGCSALMIDAASSDLAKKLGPYLDRLLLHILGDSHLRIRKWLCGLCHFPFNNTNGLLQHFDTQHEGSQPCHFSLWPAKESVLRYLLAEYFPAFRSVHGRVEPPGQESPANTDSEEEEQSTDDTEASPVRESSPESSQPLPQTEPSQSSPFATTKTEPSQPSPFAQTEAPASYAQSPVYSGPQMYRQPEQQFLAQEPHGHNRYAMNTPYQDRPGRAQDATPYSAFPKQGMVDQRTPVPTGPGLQQSTPYAHMPTGQQHTPYTLHSQLPNGPIPEQRTPYQQEFGSAVLGSGPYGTPISGHSQSTGSPHNRGPSGLGNNAWSSALEEVRSAYVGKELICAFPNKGRCAWRRRFQINAAESHAFGHANTGHLFECEACSAELRLSSDARKHLTLCATGSPRIQFVGDQDALLGVLELAFPDAFGGEDEEEPLPEKDKSASPLPFRVLETSALKVEPGTEDDVMVINETVSSGATLATRPGSEDGVGIARRPSEAPALTAYKAALWTLARRFSEQCQVACCRHCGPVNPPSPGPEALAAALEFHVLSQHLNSAPAYECGVCGDKVLDIEGHFGRARAAGDSRHARLRFHDLRAALMPDIQMLMDSFMPYHPGRGPMIPSMRPLIS